MGPFFIQMPSDGNIVPMLLGPRFSMIGKLQYGFVYRESIIEHRKTFLFI
jgi:hypothetical protein